jgi:hypothetical protein
MMKYHVNPDTGQPGLCRAQQQCRFGSAQEHYPTKEIAQKAYETANVKKLFAVPSSKSATAQSLTSPVTSFLEDQYTNFNRDRALNMGEYSEAISGLAPLLHNTNLAYIEDNGVTHSVEAIDFGNVFITNTGKVTLPSGLTFTIDVASVSAYAEDFTTELATRGEGSTEEKAEKVNAIREAAAKVWASVGLSDLPKAPATQKSDFYAIVNGKRKGVSVKSFMGSPPTIANSSGANTSTSRFPTSMTLDEAETFAEKVNSNSSASVRLAVLREAKLSPPLTHQLPEIFTSNLSTISKLEGITEGKLAQDYSSAVTKFYLGDKTLSDDEKSSLRLIATHYSRGMVASLPYVPEENDVELFMIQNNDGTSELHTARNNNIVMLLEEASSTYRKNQLARVTVIQEGAKVYLDIPLSASFRAVPNTSRRATF